MKLVTLAGALLLISTNPATGQPARQAVIQSPRAAEPEVAQLSVRIAGRSYATTAWSVPIRRAAIYGLDPDEGAARKSGAPFAYDIASLARVRPQSIVVNGGFSGAEPSQPAGLLLVGGRIVKAISRSKYRDGRYRLSAVLCQSQSGELSILRTADVVSQPSRMRRCVSAIQAGPLVVENGRNGIGVADMAGNAYVRTMVGTDSTGRAYAIVFTRPIHLYAAAEFLLAPRGNSADPVALRSTSSGAAASRGLGLLSAMNLDGDTSTALVHLGRPLVGDPLRPRPSAIVID